jgi:hypothetical protein
VARGVQPAVDDLKAAGDQPTGGLDAPERTWSTSRRVLIGIAIVVGLVAGGVAWWSLTGDTTTGVRSLDGDPEPTGSTRSAGAGTDASDASAAPTTVVPATTIPLPVVAGTSHYVDVDLRCEAFELEGIWVLDEGDTSTWQPSGDRHEGGMFTLDADDHGTFVGDVQGMKTATFRRVGAGESPACAPIPR